MLYTKIKLYKYLLKQKKFFSIAKKKTSQEPLSFYSAIPELTNKAWAPIQPGCNLLASIFPLPPTHHPNTTAQENSTRG